MNLIWDKLYEAFAYSEKAPMLFNSGLFFTFFTAFLMLYALLYNRVLARTIYVTAFSLFFYYKSSGKYVLILIISIIYNYFAAREISKSEDQRFRKVLLWFSIVFDAGFLVYFKYAYFLTDNFNSAIGTDFQLWDIFLPIGISFFTFQTISYIVDVYKKNHRAY